MSSDGKMVVHLAFGIGLSWARFDPCRMESTQLYTGYSLSLQDHAVRRPMIPGGK